jgi:predicted peptidase
MYSIHVFSRSPLTLRVVRCTRFRYYYVEIALVLCILALAVQFCWPAVSSWWRQPWPGSLGVVRLPTELHSRSLGPHCLVYLPSEYRTTERWPVVLYLHGSGVRGYEIQRVRQYGLPRHLDEGNVYPAMVAAPQCREGANWRPDELVLLLDLLGDQFSIDESRIYVVGESMGGYGAWDCAACVPEKLAAVVPLCGGGDPKLADKLVRLPIWAFHGEEDDVIPPSESQEMVDAIKLLGGQARLTILPGQGHNLSDIPCKNQELIEWMLRQRQGGVAHP